LGHIEIGDNCVFRSAEWANSIGINRHCFISVGKNSTILISDGSGFSGTIINAAKSITIGKDVLCGANCTICDNDRHPLDPLNRKNNLQFENAPIVIEDNVFLGMNSVVLKGVRIGKGTVVAANSIVTNSLPQNVLAGGTPARVIREKII
jgi:acetyltransferase-like isoleucine patch superfamily enzyme